MGILDTYNFRKQIFFSQIVNFIFVEIFEKLKPISVYFHLVGINKNILEYSREKGSYCS